ncbi:7302_t:CDS:2 [Ambispora leptoticha]|uniref:7302_t:CDS:1 n=1 Tax=Ambispora leptoticha TaxID=144679 RepID=A0A9N9FK63_9GLOM|nr:7302_t:CDS:2 [Ambispora leptoticha]
MKVQEYEDLINIALERGVNNHDVELRELKSTKLLYRKTRHTTNKKPYCITLIDPISDVALVEIQAQKSDSKLKQILLFQPREEIPFDNTGKINFEYKFLWENEEYYWQKCRGPISEGLEYSLECKMVHDPNPSIVIALYHQKLNTLGIMNMDRIPANNKRGLEYVLCITLLSLLDEWDDKLQLNAKNLANSDSKQNSVAYPQHKNANNIQRISLAPIQLIPMNISDVEKSINETDWIDTCKLEFGLIFSRKRIRKAKEKIFNIIKPPYIRYNDTGAKNKPNFSYYQSKIFSFLASSCISTDSDSVDSINKILNLEFPDSSLIKNYFDSERRKPAIHFCVYNEQLIIDISNDCIEPTESFSKEMEDALNKYNPYPELEALFNKYGYFYETKIIVGAKLDQLFEFESSDISRLNSQWSELKEVYYPQNPEKEWGVIDRQIKPLYQSLTPSLSAKVELLLEAKPRILMTGSNQVKNYKWIKFSKELHKADFHIFGRIVNKNNSEEIKFVPKFDYYDIGGFGISIEGTGNNQEYEKEYTVFWIMIGIPNEVRYSDPLTRDIEIVKGSKLITIKEDKFSLNTEQKLHPGLILTISFKFPESNFNPLVETKILSWTNRGIINIEILDLVQADYDPCGNEKKVLKQLHGNWLVILY